MFSTQSTFFFLKTRIYPSPRSTFLVYNGKKLPAKHIRGMAYKVAFGKEISKSEYSGGVDTVRFFKNLGFEVSYTSKANVVNDVNTPMEQGQDDHLIIDMKEESPAPVTGQVMPLTTLEAKKQSSIRITAKGVIEQKNALQILLNKLFDGDVVCEKT